MNAKCLSVPGSLNAWCKNSETHDELRSSQIERKAARKQRSMEVRDPCFKDGSVNVGASGPTSERRERLENDKVPGRQGE